MVLSLWSCLRKSTRKWTFPVNILRKAFFRCAPLRCSPRLAPRERQSGVRLGNRERHISKNHIKFLKSPWTAGCPRHTRPVSRQNALFCQFFYGKQQEIHGKSMGHRPVDPCLSRRVSQKHPAGVPRIFLSLCASFFPDRYPTCCQPEISGTIAELRSCPDTL